MPIMIGIFHFSLRRFQRLRRYLLLDVDTSGSVRFR